MKFGKEKKTKDPSPCESCGVGHQMSQEDMVKKLREMEKKKVQPTPCPYIDVCEFQMLSEGYHAVCMDEETPGLQSQSYMTHMAGYHIWQGCHQYLDRIRKEKGKTPKEWKAEESK